MHGAQEFLKALTTVLAVAAVTTVVFQRLRQPVVLGYNGPTRDLRSRRGRRPLHLVRHVAGPNANCCSSRRSSRHMKSKLMWPRG